MWGLSCEDFETIHSVTGLTALFLAKSRGLDLGRSDEPKGPRQEILRTLDAIASP